MTLVSRCSCAAEKRQQKDRNKEHNILVTLPDMLQIYCGDAEYTMIFVTLRLETQKRTDHGHTAETLPDRHTDIRGYPE